jgi:hypothetical protein
MPIEGRAPLKSDGHSVTLCADMPGPFTAKELSRRIRADAAVPSGLKKDLLTFLGNAPDFDLSATRLDDYLKSKGDCALQGVRDPNRITNQLKAMQRVAHVTPNYEGIKTFLSKGLDSAKNISELADVVFVDQPKGKSKGKADKP